MQTLDTLSATAPPHASTNAPPLAQSHSNAAFPQSGSISVPPTVSLLNPSQLPTASSIVSQSALLRDCAGAVANKETAALLYSPRSNSSLYTSPLCRYGRVQTAWADKAAEGSAAAPRVAASASSETFSERDSVTAPSFTTNALTLPDWDAHTAGAAAGAGFKRQSAAPCAPPASPGKALTGNAQCCHADDVSHRSLPAAEDAVPLHNADLDIPTVVSATTMHTSSVRMDSSAAEGGSRKNESCCSRGLVARSDDSGNSATPSAAPSLFAGAPPPSGLRDPVTLLQLLSIDLLLQPDDPTSPSSLFAMGGGGRVGGNLSRDGEPLRGALTRVGNPLQQPNTTPLSDYCRAFSLLRCAAKPSSVLSCSRGWQDCRNVDPTRPPDASSVYAALGRVMAELERCHQAGGPPLHANAVLSAFCEDTRAGPRLAEGTVLLCSLAGSVDSAQPHEQCPHAAGVHACDGAHSGDSTVVPLLFFAAAVECPPDIRRYFVVSRTHAYLCEPNGTVAYCAAVQDIRQIVACAGGYMVWRFMPDAMVSTMIARNVGDDKRKATGAAASSTTARGWKPGSASPTQTQRVDSSSPTAPSSGSPKFPAAAGETRDEMSDWVFRILSVGCPRVALAGAAANLPPSGNDGGDPSCAATSSFLNSVQDDRLLEERMSATVFLLNVMCTLRTLPRLLTDALVNGSTAATEADGVSPSSIASAAFSSTQLRSSNANSSSSSCATAAHASALDHPSNACARVSDRLDRMHVAGDRLYRIPLLLEGPAGHQTAVKFIECCWTTRYDQLPPSLRPRRFSAVSYLGSTGAQALPTTLPPLDGDSAAHLCYVESSLLIPPIPVLSLEACLNAEDSVMEMLQASSNALHAAPTAAAANVLNSPEASTATKCCGRTSSDAASLDSIPLRDLADASEKATAKACLSPAAWRVLEQLIHGSGEGATNASDLGGDGRQGEGAAGGSLWLDGNAPTAPLTTSAAASTSVSCHAEASVAAPSRDASTATSGVASHDGEKRGSSPRASFSGSHGPACHPIESPADAAGEASLLEAPHNQRRTADGRDTFGDQHVSAPGSRRMGRTASGSSRVSITVEGALDMPPPQPTPWEGDAAAAADSGDGASPLLSKSLDVARSSTSILRHESSRVSIAQASMKRKLLDSVSKAVMQARLRRQRPDELEEAKGRTHADFSSLGADHPRGGAHNAAPCLPQIGVAVPAMDAESDATSALSLPSPTKVVEDFERRIQHRPLPDRLLLRAHYVERLLKSRLLCSARGGQCIGCSEEEMRPPQRNEPAAAPCPSLVAPTDAFAPLMPEDSGDSARDPNALRRRMPLAFAQRQLAASRRSKAQLALAANAAHAACAEAQDARTDSDCFPGVTLVTNYSGGRTPRSIVFPIYLEYRSVCASAYEVPPADSRWMAEVAQRLRWLASRSTTPVRTSNAPLPGASLHDYGRHSDATPLDPSEGYAGATTLPALNKSSRFISDVREQRRRLLQWDEHGAQDVCDAPAITSKRAQTDELESVVGGVELPEEPERLRASLTDCVKANGLCSAALLRSCLIQDRLGWSAGDEGVPDSSEHLLAAVQVAHISSHPAKRCVLSPLEFPLSLVPPRAEVVLTDGRSGRDMTGGKGADGELPGCRGGGEEHTQEARRSDEVRTSPLSDSVPLQRQEQAFCAFAAQAQEVVLRESGAAALKHVSSLSTAGGASPPPCPEPTAPRTPSRAASSAERSPRATPIRKQQHNAPETAVTDAVTAALLQSAVTPSARRSLPQRCHVQMGVDSHVAAWERRRRRVGGLHALHAAVRSCWWTWWCPAVWMPTETEDGRLACRINEERLESSGGAAEDPRESPPKIKVAAAHRLEHREPGAHWMRGPTHAAQLSSISAGAVVGSVTPVRGEEGGCQHTSAEPLTQRSVREMWRSIAESIGVEEMGAVKQRAELACRQRQAAVDGLLSHARAAEPLTRMQCPSDMTDSWHRQSDVATLRDHPALPCWHERLPLFIALHVRCSFRIPPMQAEDNERAAGDKQLPALCSLMRGLAGARWRSVSWLPWEAWIVEACNAARVPPLLTPSAQAWCWMDAAAQRSRFHQDVCTTAQRGVEDPLKSATCRAHAGAVAFSMNAVSEEADRLLQTSEVLSSVPPSPRWALGSSCAGKRPVRLLLEGEAQLNAFTERRQSRFAEVSPGAHPSCKRGSGAIKETSHRPQPHRTGLRRQRSEEIEGASVGGGEWLRDKYAADHPMPMKLLSDSQAVAAAHRRVDGGLEGEGDTSCSLSASVPEGQRPCFALHSSSASLSSQRTASQDSGDASYREDETSVPCAPPSPASPSLQVLGGDSSSVCECPFNKRERSEASREEARLAFISTISRREAAAQQRRHAKALQALISSLLRGASFPDLGNGATAKAAAGCVRGSSAAAWWMRLARVEARCKAYRRVRPEGEAEGCSGGTLEDTEERLHAAVRTACHRSQRASASPPLCLPSSVLPFDLLRACIVRPPPKAALLVLSTLPRPRRMAQRAGGAHASLASPDASGAMAVALARTQAGESGVHVRGNPQPPSFTPRLAELMLLQAGNEISHALLVGAAQAGGESTSYQTSTIVSRTSTSALRSRDFISLPSASQDSKHTAGDAIVKGRGGGVADAGTVYLSLRTHWPLFTLRNFASERLSGMLHDPPLYIAADAAKEGPTGTASKAMAVNKLYGSLHVGDSREAVWLSSILRVQARHRTRYRALRHAFHRHILTQKPSTCSHLNTVPSSDAEDLLRAQLSSMCQRYRRELVRDDLVELDRCARSALAHAQLEACRDALTSYGSKPPASAAVRKNSLNGDGVDGNDDVAVVGPCGFHEPQGKSKHEGSCGGASWYHRSQFDVPPATPADPRAARIHCTAGCYRRSLQTLLCSGLLRDGWLLFHTHWHEALAGCLEPRPAFRPSLRSVEGMRWGGAVDGGCSRHRGDVTWGEGLMKSAGSACDMAACCEMRWYVDSEDDDESEEQLEAMLSGTRRVGKSPSKRVGAEKASVHRSSSSAQGSQDAEAYAAPVQVCVHGDAQRTHADSAIGTQPPSTLPLFSPCCSSSPEPSATPQPKWPARGHGGRGRLSAAVHAVAASTRFLFFYLEDSPCNTERACVLPQHDSEDDTGAASTGLAAVVSTSSRQVSEPRRCNRQARLCCCLRDYSMQLLAGACACAEAGQRPRNARAHPTAELSADQEMEREVQPLRRHRYTRHVFAFHVERHFLLAEVRVSWARQQAAQRLQRVLAMKSQRNSADEEVGGAGWLMDTTMSERATQALPSTASSPHCTTANAPSLLNDGGALNIANPQNWMQLRHLTHLQHMRTPAGPLWRHREALQDAVSKARQTDAALHFTYIAYMLRDRTSTLGSPTTATLL